MNALVEAGRERIRALQLHHKKTLQDLRHHHRALVSQKQRDHRRKLAELLKDHEEEIQIIKAEQVASMEELIATQKESEQIQKDNDTSEKLLGMMLPGHVLEDLEAGVTPEPKSFENVTIFFTDIPQFKSLSSTVDSVALLNLLNLVYTKFDEVIQDNPALYKVNHLSRHYTFLRKLSNAFLDTYMVAAGLSGNAKPSQSETQEVTGIAVACALKLLDAFKSIDLSDVGITEKLDLRIGIHTGPVLAGIVGTKMGRYCLFGDTVNTASRMCTTSDPSAIQVSPSTYEIVNKCPDFQFEKRGEVNVKGKGKMTTYWLQA
ncbi:adenylate and guanylate cyclase catalytic domain-containing protein [Chytridium lagenaria]|nr:adenylate and guanylate cyclase catalytic domain-containing protein [Chytridium lagenaria]